MLTLKMDLFHSGKEDTNSDHKLVEERVIEVPVPAQPNDGHSISLEDCLTTYFDNRVEVYRFQQGRRNTLSSTRSGMSDDMTKGQAWHVEVTSVQDSQPSTPQAIQSPGAPSPTMLVRPASDRERLPSIFASTVDPEKAELAASSSPRRYSDLTSSRRRAGSLKKEVKMSAWQFFNLIRKYFHLLFELSAYELQRGSIRQMLKIVHQVRTLRLPALCRIDQLSVPPFLTSFKFPHMLKLFYSGTHSSEKVSDGERSKRAARYIYRYTLDI